jgi:hypothetical protein
MMIRLPKTKTVVVHRTCEYHQAHPEDHNYPGCTCSSTYSATAVEEDDRPEPAVGAHVKEAADVFRRIFR